MTTPQFELSDPPSDAISAVQFASSSALLLVSSWDKHVYIYQLDSGTSRLVRRFEYRAPVLDACWGSSEDQFYSGGLDWDVRRIDRATGDQTVLSSHEAAVKSVAYSSQHQVLISASWDSTIHIHHVASSPGEASEYQPSTIKLPHKPFSISLSPTKLVVAMAARALHIYDLKSLALLSSQGPSDAPSSLLPPPEVNAEPWQRRESSLKFLTRAVACMPNDSGYASASIEGRVAVEWFDPSSASQARKYAFKCHRQPDTTAPNGSTDLVYPVNALAFHPKHGTFASGGGDGFVALWDGVAKRRIRQFQKLPASVAALDFSDDGKWLAIGVSPGFEDGKEDLLGEGEVKVFVRELAEGDAKGKAR